jgi:valyl-tRNA synthetase
MSTHRDLKISLGLTVLVLSTTVYSAEPNSPVAIPPGQSEMERLQRDLQSEIERLQEILQSEKYRSLAFQRLIAKEEKRSNELQAELDRLRERCKNDSMK